MDSPLALYRRYRPETFAQVIGQDHVTAPLRNALANDRVNHAYLFSGPRGCGKTTSARILARTLNCAQAPTAEPCGECDSCRDLATGGSGSIDVIEIDAASHGGVDDARDLREKAHFAPVRDRYKIYIIDEAHMVSPQGFNALLKLVEEPPAHLRFIFATTEPEKVIPTIRSRTHHYPFRLIPPRMLSDYVDELCLREGVAIEPAAVPLVVRAGAGSARDTLSVLDQLMGGSGADGVTHELAVALLGFTPDSLLDEIVEAFAASDGHAVFRVVDKVIESGQDPRRFAEDLLRRLRDLVIVAAVPDAPVTGLIDVSRDQGERLVAQAARFGQADLSRAADLVASGLMDMKGAISPRLLLELVCARVLLPGADDTAEGLQARLDRMEKRLSIPGTPAPPAPAPPAPVPPVPAPPVQAPPIQAPPVQAPAPPEPVRHQEQVPQRPDVTTPAPVQPAEPTGWAAPPREQPPAQTQPAQTQPAQTQPAQTQQAQSPPAQEAPAGGLTLVDVRRLWPDIVNEIRTRRRLAWMLLTQNAQVVAVDATTLTLGFDNPGARESFVKGGSDEVLRLTAIDVVGVDWKIDAVVDHGAVPTGSDAASHTVVRPAVPAEPTEPAPAPSAQAPTQPSAQAPTQPSAQAPVHPSAQAPADPASTPQSPAVPHHAPEPPPYDGPEPDDDPYAEGPSAPASVESGLGAAQTRAPVGAGVVDRARGAIQQTRSGGEPPMADDNRALADAAVSPDDPVADPGGLDSAELLKRTLGARVIEEINHE